MWAPDMMSSVIPARLEFQCGHAALVSLPKIKNESSAQRNERIAREKVEARGRRCDFCGPLVTEVVAAPALTNGNNGAEGHHAAPPKPLAVVSSAAPAPVAPRPQPVVVAKTVVPAKPVVVANPVVPAAPAAPAPTPVAVVAKPVVVAPKPAVARKPVVAAPKPVVLVRTRAPLAEGVAAKRAAAKRYAVRFKAEQVLQAASLREALRKAESLGAIEVLTITAM
jgi:hypothetical protein